MSLSQFSSSGNTLPYTPQADVDAGDIVVIETVVAQVVSDTKAGEPGSVQIEGVIKFPKNTGAIGAGINCYWDDDADSILGSASGAVSLNPANGPLAGFAAVAAGSSDPYVYVKLTPTGDDDE